MAGRRRRRNDVSDSSSEEEYLCDYEKKRLENIKKNHELLRSLGLPVKSQPKKKKKKPRKKSVRGRGGDEEWRPGGESSSEEEWQPWMEERPKRRTGRVPASAKLPPLDAASKSKIMTDVIAQVDQKFKMLDDAEGGCKPPPIKKPRTTQPQRKKPRARPSAQPLPLPTVFNSDSDESDKCAGFQAAGVMKERPSFCELPAELFESDGEEDFKGFTLKDLMETSIPDECLHRYPRRVKVRKHYQEPELSDEDEYLFCEDCNELHHGDCPIHGPLKTLDQHAGFDEASKEFTSVPVPGELTVKTSSIPNAGLGVFSKQFIPRGVKVGPYEGKVVWKDEVADGTDTSYMWEIKRDDHRAFYVDGRDESSSNWMRLINCARNEEEQNLVAFQYCGHIYYRSFKHIYPGTELLVWYGEEYARELGIPVDFYGLVANFACKGCGESFMENRSFQIHLRSNRQCSRANPQVFKCGRCLQTFGELYQLQQHIRRHVELTQLQPSKPQSTGAHSGNTGDKPFKCDYCSKAFTNSGHLQTHLLIHTGDKPYKCDFCGKGFNQSGNLQTHLRTHTGDKPYKCDFCGKGFNQSSTLQRHWRTHTGDKPYKCDFCGKGFNQSGNLQTHLRTHTGDKPYKCDFCGKGFNKSSNLQTHLRTHTGDKPYKCDFCGKGFNQSSTLQTHLHTHTGEKPFRCDLCGKAISHRSALRSHRCVNTDLKPLHENTNS